MQRSSETIGTIAGALAKAQAELTNPEKSLVAFGPMALARSHGRSVMRRSPVGLRSSARP
jgi:hypothetical protein